MPEGTESLTTAVAQRRAASPEAAAIAYKIQYAKTLAEASLLPASYKKQPGNVLLAIELADSLGIKPMTAIQNVHVIEGKPSASSSLIASLVRRAGHRLRVTVDNEKLLAVAEIVRADDPDFSYRSVWTMDRAKKAGLTNKSVWQNYPGAMLKARAITEVARDACSEALLGVQYTPEELGQDVDADTSAGSVDDRVRPDSQPVDAEVIDAEFTDGSEECKSDPQ